MAPRYKDKEVRLRCSRLFSSVCGLVSGPVGGIVGDRFGARDVLGGGQCGYATASGSVAMVGVDEGCA